MYYKQLENGDRLVTLSVSGGGTQALVNKVLHPGDPDYDKYPPMPDLDDIPDRQPGEPDSESDLDWLNSEMSKASASAE